ncbi:hypothetical protein H1164_15735 [Thermoactinomyces daqus]|uniref:Uncharacterized protein n=1 Tax=Thermoactinomyces daqus TaxID=1329516 RepID=A0A7W2AJW8_9BACL|nr:hypothetical protein [Thermoactinomyces daqus]MBA4544303.1 hypothetical protein [Thermoactinomyces daqus]
MPRKKKPDGPIPPSVPLFRELENMNRTAKPTAPHKADRTAKPTVKEKLPPKALERANEESFAIKTV